MFLKQIINTLLTGDARMLGDPNITEQFHCIVNEMVSKGNKLEPKDVETIGDILHIGNIIYNNLPLDDDDQWLDNGVYDILLERYKEYAIPQVGGEPVNFTLLPPQIKKTNLDVIPLVSFIDNKELIYQEDLINAMIPITKQSLSSPLVSFMGMSTDKKYRVVSHADQKLVGTLDKCKYVLNKQAIEKGVYDDPSVKILERDFFEPHFRAGLIDMKTILKMVLELKYDGISVSATIDCRKGILISAESRGDTGMDKATDLTPILYGYEFPKLRELFKSYDEDLFIQVKFEAVMSYTDLYYYNIARGKQFKNCRSAVIGLFSSNDGYMYRNFVTLVPLAIGTNEVLDKALQELNPDNYRLAEIEFLNSYIATKELLRYSYIEGTFDHVMFMIKKFVDEAEFVRPIMPVMYDGVVLSYTDNHIKEILGRENFVNKYSIAIKFNAMKKQTKLLAITYTIGQNGVITPMAHYEPVEFLGTIHTKSSISSAARFAENHFKIGNIIEVEYRNDVMPYVSTPSLDYNLDNPNPELEFIKTCPECGTELIVSKSGKSVICPNVKCKGRKVARMANMMDKLGLKDFAEATMEKIDKSNLYEIINISKEELVPIIGEINAYKFTQRIKELHTVDMYDYQIVGALGFSDIAQETWKKIFQHYTMEDVYAMYMSGQLVEALYNIKGIGPATTNTITEEFEMFIQDWQYIQTMKNIKPSFGVKQKTIRVTGFRDPELMEKLCSLGFDASDKSVTKETDMLIYKPNPDGTLSSKMKKVGPHTVVVSLDDFVGNMTYYISKL